MTQFELDREIAAATGESLRDVQQRGFTLVDPMEVERNLVADHPDYNQPPQYVDWDLLDKERNLTFFNQPLCRK